MAVRTFHLGEELFRPTVGTYAGILILLHLEVFHQSLEIARIGIAHTYSAEAERRLRAKQNIINRLPWKLLYRSL